MKVIKNNSKKRIICPSCDSILEYDHKDVNINDHIKKKYIICPICNNQIYTDLAYIPEHKDNDEKFIEKVLNCEDTNSNDLPSTITNNRL